MSAESRRGRLEAPADPPVRLTAVELPPYRYVPGVTPHPVTDPRGHSYGAREEVADLGGKTLPQDWREVEEYLLGADLFNRAFFWEAHESWEAVWHAVAKETVEGRFLQGLIQTSAALLQRHVGHPQGALNLIAKADINLQPAQDWLAEHGAERYMGIVVQTWQGRASSFARGESSDFPFLDPAD